MPDHFAQRCIERGITSTNPEHLREEIERAVDGSIQSECVLGLVMPSVRGDSDIWRFRVAEGIFYAVVGHNGKARTILTQEMVRSKKWARKQTKRGRRR